MVTWGNTLRNVVHTDWLGSGNETEEPISEKDLTNMKEAIRKLHVRSGHLSNRALASTLKSRGVDRQLVQLAYEHRCDDCKEVHLPVLHRNVTLHQTETLWHTLQVDIGQFTFSRHCGPCAVHDRRGIQVFGGI